MSERERWKSLLVNSNHWDACCQGRCVELSSYAGIYWFISCMHSHSNNIPIIMKLNSGCRCILFSYQSFQLHAWLVHNSLTLHFESNQPWNHLWHHSICANESTTKWTQWNEKYYVVLLSLTPKNDAQIWTHHTRLSPHMNSCCSKKRSNCEWRRK